MKENRKNLFKQMKNASSAHMQVFVDFKELQSCEMSKAFKFVDHGLMNTLSFIQLSKCLTEANLGHSHSNQRLLFMQLATF